MWKFYVLYSIVCVVPPVCQSESSVDRRFNLWITLQDHSSSEETVCQFEHSYTCQKLHADLVKKKLLNVGFVVSKNAIVEAADEVRKLKNTSDVAECGVSVDGTWQKTRTFIVKWLCRCSFN
ncbi:hypothetical protein TNCV_1354351 [Trichonephila clavipes]|nr:hypothetical protein TNCV_1354351 [Trichonephila clavipes]